MSLSNNGSPDSRRQTGGGAGRGLPGEDGVQLRFLLEALEGAGRKGADTEWLAGRLRGEHEPESLRRDLQALERRGEAVEWNRRWYAMRFTDWRVGRLESLRGGRALARTGAGGEAGYLLRRGDLNGARDGDLVLIKPRRRKKGRGYGGLPEASVSKVLERRWRTMVGCLARDGRGWRLEPFDTRARMEVRLEDAPASLADRMEVDDYVVVSLLDRPAAEGRAWGRVLEVLGPLDRPGVDLLAVLRHFEIPEAFPEEVLESIGALPEDPSEADRAGRLDLSGVVTVTIDGETARDFDDAISVRPVDRGGFELGVHIADVSHYVVEGSALDVEAYRRGTSVYFPERAVPMLPERLSNGLCSLRPEVPRLTLSAFLEVDREGEIVGRRFATSWIRSARRMTYGEVARLLDDPRPGDEAEYGEILTMLRQAETLRGLLLRRRMRGGSLDLDLPEVELRLDEDGQVSAIEPAERTVAHRLIEEFMIAANEAVATELSAHEVGAIHRVHDPPGAQAYEELRAALAAVGYTLPSDLEALSPEPFQRLLGKIEGQALQALVSGLILRSMQRAEYRTEGGGHFALALRHYLHFTSPIRRYPDLIVHRQLKKRLREEDGDGALLGERLERIAAHSSRTERRAESAEREARKWKKVRFLSERVGETFLGTITGVQPFGLFVQLDEYLVDGLIPVRRLADDFYLYEADRQRLIGEASGRIFRLGDSLEVVLTNVDVAARMLDFEVPGMPPPRRRQGDRPRPRSLR